MNIANLNDADLQALDKLNRHRFQAMDPLFRDGAQADEAGPKGNLGANPPDHDGALDDVATALLAPPGGPASGQWQPVRDVMEKLGGGAQT
jgi:hypothetical protein